MAATNSERRVCDICGIEKDDVQRIDYGYEREGLRLCEQCNNISKHVLFPNETNVYKLRELILQSKQQKKKVRELVCELVKTRKLELETKMKTITDTEQKRELEEDLKNIIQAFKVLNCSHV